MSYDIYLRGDKCEHCGHEDGGPECPDPTYNLTPIFDLALTGEPLPNESVPEVAVVLFGADTDGPRGLRVLSGRRASDTATAIDRAIARMLDPVWEPRFRELEPSNGWGTLKDALWVMRRLRELGEEHPAHRWEIR